jgi:sarcosine oxidase
VERARVVVVGAGVMGAATAWALARRGVQTTLVEQFRVGHTRGASHGPTRIFRLSYPHPDYTRLSHRALDVWRALEDESGDELLVRTGGLDVGPQAEDCRRSLHEVGLPYEVLSADEAANRFPAIDFTGLDPILYQPGAGVCLADRTVEALVRAAVARGVGLRENTTVTGFDSIPDGVRIETTVGEIQGDVVVVTPGPWAARLLPQMGLPAVPLTPLLQHVSYYGPPDGDIPTFIDWSGRDLSWYALPPAGMAPGVKVGHHVGGSPVDPNDGPFDVDPDRIAAHAEYVRRRFPGLDPEPVHAETCLYSMTPDEDFILDRVGPMVIGAGFSGHGFKFAPVIGEILAEYATGVDPKLPGNRFAIARAVLRP